MGHKIRDMKVKMVGQNRQHASLSSHGSVASCNSRAAAVAKNAIKLKWITFNSGC